MKSISNVMHASINGWSPSEVDALRNVRNAKALMYTGPYRTEVRGANGAPAAVKDREGGRRYENMYSDRNR